MTDSWATPATLYEALNAEFHFNDDPCPLDESIYAIRNNDGLNRVWGKSVYLNPPYSNPMPWVKKAYEESLRGSVVVALLKADTSTAWFHDWVLGKAEIRFLRGRVHFVSRNNQITRCPFANIIAIWGK